MEISKEISQAKQKNSTSEIVFGPILSTINSPKDLRKLGVKELTALAAEIREVIIDVCSLNGGHLSPSLGAVELAIATRYMFPELDDKVIWDVGHQAYADKLITGRREDFLTLRQLNGISGFPSIRESPLYDAYGAGHAGSVDAALGIAEGCEILGKKSNVIDIMGDGALGVGENYEGLNDAGHWQKNLTVILNDNNRSISGTNGAFQRRGIEALEEIFRDLGYWTRFVKDGHDIGKLVDVLEESKGVNTPKLIHIITKKGKGYAPAEDNPGAWHGVGPFNRDTATINSSKPGFCNVFGDKLVELAKDDNKIIVITAGMKDGTGLAKFAKRFPKQFRDVGIAEQEAVNLAGGLAAADFKLRRIKPCVAMYSTFLQRAEDQVIQNIALQKLPVRFFIDRGGIVGEDGATHHGCFDISYMRMIPNMVVMASKDENELTAMMDFMMGYGDGPISVRYPRGSTGATLGKPVKPIEMGKAEMVREGKDVTIISIGTMLQEATKAADMLKLKGIDAEVINARFVKPLDEGMIHASVKKTGKIITIEENSVKGGFGSAVLESLSDADILAHSKIIGVPDQFIEHGSQKKLREKYGLTAENISNTAEYMYRNDGHTISQILKLQRTESSMSSA